MTGTARRDDHHSIIDRRLPDTMGNMGQRRVSSLMFG
jgi:hypothetical protein